VSNTETQPNTGANSVSSTETQPNTGWTQMFLWKRNM
jgi:hypothetical protein